LAHAYRLTQRLIAPFTDLCTYFTRLPSPMLRHYTKHCTVNSIILFIHAIKATEVYKNPRATEISNYLRLASLFIPYFSINLSAVTFTRRQFVSKLQQSKSIIFHCVLRSNVTVTSMFSKALHCDFRHVIYSILQFEYLNSCCNI
jgi:hypothetical protein